MVTIELESGLEACLNALAARRGQSPNQLARQILEDFLAFRNRRDSPDEEWAEASVALLPEVASPECWNERE